jgi:hypothetical protein
MGFISGLPVVDTPCAAPPNFLGAPEVGAFPAGIGFLVTGRVFLIEEPFASFGEACSSELGRFVLVSVVVVFVLLTDFRGGSAVAGRTSEEGEEYNLRFLEAFDPPEDKISSKNSSSGFVAFGFDGCTGGLARGFAGVTTARVVPFVALTSVVEATGVALNFCSEFGIVGFVRFVGVLSTSFVLGAAVAGSRVVGAVFC